MTSTKPASVAAMLRGFDLVTLVVVVVVVVPVLAPAQVAARRGSDRASLLCLAMLAYLAYYLSGVPFNDGFLTGGSI